MTTTAAAPAPASAPTTLDPTVRQRASRLRGLALGLTVLLALGLLGALLSRPGTQGALDPESFTPQGARAVAQVLAGQGVRVERVEDRATALAAGAGSTLLVTLPALLSEDDWTALDAIDADLVLVSPPGGLDVIEPVGGQPIEVRDRSPACSLPVALRAGTALTGGLTYTARPRPGDLAETCYAEGGRASVVQVQQADGRRITALGSAGFLTNDRASDAGNAALGLGLLGAQPELVWWLPRPELDGATPLRELLPDWVLVVAAQLLVVVAALAAWRARRLGPVVVEPLPVVVRAAEATEGRARLYRRAHARDRAAEQLRGATARRLLAPLGLPRQLPPADARASLVSAVAARTGRDAAAVDALLYGAAPPDDAALVALADALDALAQEVSHP